MPVSVLEGDALEVLRGLPDASAQCCVTSPPYFGLRAYLPEGHAAKAMEVGAEASPDAYVARLVALFREVRRVLRDDGTLWLNLGDSYAGGGGGPPGRGLEADGYARGHTDQRLRAAAPLPPKNRLMIPARVALALQADGWWLRDEIVWHKPRTMPFPANDRTVPAHEMVYLLSKSARYFFDWQAIEEPAIHAGDVRKRGKAFRLHGKAKADTLATLPKANSYGGGDGDALTVRDTRRARSVWSINPEPYREGHFATMPTALVERCILAGSRPGDAVLDPFGGAGTTGLTADRLQRDATLIELNPEYVALARARIQRDATLLGDVA